MVTIQPLHFEKVTAFKERIQLLNKINEIIAELGNYPTETEMMQFVTNELSSYYTKEEVEELIQGIDLDNYYTKSEVNNIRSLVNYMQSDALLETFNRINNRFITVEDEIVGKQDVLTAGNGIDISNGTVSVIGTIKNIYPSNDWLDGLTEIKNNERYTKYNVEFVLCDFTNGISNSFFIRKGTQLTYQGTYFPGTKMRNCYLHNESNNATVIVSRETTLNKLFSNSSSVSFDTRQLRLTTSVSITIGTPVTYNKYQESYDGLSTAIMCYYWD